MRKSSDDKFLPDEFGVEGPAWADGKIINEAIFCEEFLSKHKILFSGGSFFTTEGRVHEVIVQIGNREDTNSKSSDSEIAVRILDEYMKHFYTSSLDNKNILCSLGITRGIYALYNH